MSEIRFVYVTARDIEQARSIGRTIVEQRLAACANIFPQMESIYRWNGGIQSDNETVLILKTEARLVPQVIQAVEKLHSYDTPCALSFAIEDGAKKYLNWLEAETR